MRIGIFVAALLLCSCAKQESRVQKPPTAEDEARIEQMVLTLYKGMEKAYNEGGVNSDSLLDAYYDSKVSYVTPWGWTEPLDSTKARLRRAFGRVANYTHHVEISKVKSLGDAAFAFFVLRQQYTVDGNPLDEYLPTTFVLERRGGEWKIVHSHRSTDAETMQQYFSQQQKKAALEK